MSNSTQTNLRTAMTKQREILAAMISRSMRKLSRQCVAHMDDRQAMEKLLTTAFKDIKYCKHLYVMDENMVQLVSNVSRDGFDNEGFGRDRSDRPYMAGIVGTTNFALSQGYISRNLKRPSLTAVRVIRGRKNQLLGFLGADYDLRELPATRDLYNETTDWQQLKGDPSIRGNLFQQQRQHSIVDDNIDEVLATIAELIVNHGVFHAKLHFSSSRAVLWMMDNPYTYRLLSPQDLTDPEISLAYPNRAYTKKAIIPTQAIMPILKIFAQLRLADENIYLRSGSINICNGMVALNFSCDGSHYIQYDKFLEKGLDFWFESAG